MHKVISINLNGNAYQLDEPGYEALREYLARAERQLEGNPDRAEILADLEQAIADKCGRYLAAHKTVITADEVARIIDEMGPVDPAADAKESGSGTAAPASDTHEKTASDAAPRRLYRIPAGAMVAGVCTGIASYANLDVTLVRVAFVIAALLTKGFALIAYVVMMFVMPEATTPEEVSGTRLNAKEVVNRARRRSAATTREWRRNWRWQQREWRRQWPPAGAAPSPLAAAFLPLFGLMHMALFLIMIAAMVSLVNTGGILDWRLPPEIPIWAGALILLVAYQFVVSPLRVAQQWTWYPGGAAAPFAFWNAVAWMIGVAFAIWLASSHIPEIREFLHRLPDLFRDFGWAMRDLFAR